MENETQQKELESWEDYAGDNFLKAVDVKSQDDAFVCIKIEEVIDTRDKTKRVRLELERNEQKWNFDLNKTNAKFAKENGIETPKHLIEKKLYFRKVYVNNPQTNKEVESLRICKIE